MLYREEYTKSTEFVANFWYNVDMAGSLAMHWRIAQ